MFTNAFLHGKNLHFANKIIERMGDQKIENVSRTKTQLPSILCNKMEGNCWLAAIARKTHGAPRNCA